METEALGELHLAVRYIYTAKSYLVEDAQVRLVGGLVRFPGGLDPPIHADNILQHMQGIIDLQSKQWYSCCPFRH